VNNACGKCGTLRIDAFWNVVLRNLCTGEQQVLLANRRRGIGEASLQKLQDYAASRGQTLSELLFGSPGAVEDGRGPEPLLLPGHKELGISANVLAKLNSFRQLMLELHASVKMRSLDLAMGDILKKVKKVGRPACRPMAGHCLSPLCLAAGGPCQQLAHVWRLVACRLASNSTCCLGLAARAMQRSAWSECRIWWVCCNQLRSWCSQPSCSPLDQARPLELVN